MPLDLLRAVLLRSHGNLGIFQVIVDRHKKVRTAIRLKCRWPENRQAEYSAENQLNLQSTISILFELLPTL